jgi:ferrous iron transport protein B
VAPVFKPLGFADWRVVTALVAGFMAKESVVSTLTVLFGSTAVLQAALSPATAVSLLIFCLLYTPCAAAIASVKQELGAKWAVGVAFGQCAVAWICALIANGICMMLL